jgi:hypothetical protein
VGHYFDKARPYNQFEGEWTSAQEAVNVLNEIRDDVTCGDSIRFFARSCHANLTWRLDNATNPKCGLNIMDISQPVPGQMRLMGDYDGLYISVYHGGLFEVIGQTADILQMNVNSFALPIESYSAEPHETLAVFWAVHANLGHLLTCPEGELLTRPHAKFLNRVKPDDSVILPLLGHKINLVP